MSVTSEHAMQQHAAMSNDSLASPSHSYGNWLDCATAEPSESDNCHPATTVTHAVTPQQSTHALSLVSVYTPFPVTCRDMYVHSTPAPHLADKPTCTSTPLQSPQSPPMSNC